MGRWVGFQCSDATTSLTSGATSQQQSGPFGSCLGTLTIGFVAVGGLNADQDVLVQQVLGVRDNGLQLREKRAQGKG